MSGGDIAVLGSGGHAKVVVATAHALGMRVVAIFDDDPARDGQTLLSVPIRADTAAASKLGVPLVIGIGSGGVRRKLAERHGGPFATLVHPAAVVHDSVAVGEGTVIFAGAVVQPDVAIGRHAILNTRCNIDHDCVIGDYAHIGPGASLCGGVTVGAGSLIGVGASAIPGVTIGAGTTVGGGAAVVRDLPDGVVATGVPAVVRHKR